MNDQSTLNALLRNDFFSFVVKVFETLGGATPFLTNWHIELIADYLVRASNRDIKRLIITLPPRSLKSQCASVALPAWVLGQDPTLRIVGASYSSDLSGKHARDCRAVMTTDWYGDVFPNTRLNPNKMAEEEFETTAGGFRLSTSVGGTLTGRGGNFIIIDDPIKPLDAFSDVMRGNANEWFSHTLTSRLDDKLNDVIIIISQRVHVDDLVGHVLGLDGWVHLNLPAIAQVPERFILTDGREFRREPGELLHPEREPQEVLDQIRSNMGSFHFESQYQQAPVPPEGNMIKWEWFSFYDEVPPRARGDRYVMSWDMAMTAHDGSDYSVCTIWAVRGPDYYLIEVIREKLEFPLLKRRVLQVQASLGARDILIEDVGVGMSMIQMLKRESPIRPIAVKPKGTKADRMAAQSSVIESGRVYLPNKASWLEEFRTEVLAFPHSKHDDQIDSMSQFLNWIEVKRRGGTRVQEILW